MNIVNKLTLRQLKLNRKRTLVTIIGTIISAAMITAVAILGLSFLDLVIRDTIASEGEWHVKYEAVNKSQLKAINSDKETKKSILSRDLGYSYLAGSQNQNKPYLYVKELDSKGFENFPIKLLEGRLPQKPNEIVLSESIISNAKVKYNIGDSITITIGQRITKKPEYEGGVLGQRSSLIWEENELMEFLTEDMTKSYTVVGFIDQPIWEYTWSPGYMVLSYIDEEIVNEEERFDVYVLAKHFNLGMIQHTEKFAEDNQIQSIVFHTELLRYYGVIEDDSVRSMLFSLSAIIILIIVIGSVSLIYNAFAISVSERSRYLGMLSSVGATKRQKRNSVFFEGALIGAISIPIGIIAGHVGIAITFLFINSIFLDLLNVAEGFRVGFHPSAILVAAVVSAGTILISTYIPARRASNVSAIDAIRQSMDVKVTRKQVKTSKLTRKLFGMEAELGLKNLKRNKRRYQATVFSLIISMVLFLVVSSFTENLRKTYSMTLDGINFDVQATIYAKSEEEKENIIQEITSLDNRKKYSVVDMLDAVTWIEETKVSEDFKRENEELSLNGKYEYQVNLCVLEGETLKEYAKETGIEYHALTDAKQLSAIVIDTVNYKDYQADKYIEAKVIEAKVGDTLELNYLDLETMKPTEIGNSLVVAGLTDKRPMGVMSLSEGINNLTIVISKNTFLRLVEGREEAILDLVNSYVFMDSEDPVKLQEEIEEVQSTYGVNRISIWNIYNYRQSEQQMLLLLSVFTYAFIILITAICIANIINTISTSIGMRKREFAMLKSVGITPKGFSKMLNYESIFYGVKALVYGLPISFGVMYLIYFVLRSSFNYQFYIPVFHIVVVVVSVFFIVGLAMLYSSSKVKKDNIIDALKQDIT